MDLALTVETFGQDDQSWLGSAHGTDAAPSITIDITGGGFVSGTHYPTGTLPSGTPLALLTASGKYGLYTEGQAGGRGTLAGYLLTAQRVRSGGDVHGALLEHGRVIVANLPFPNLTDANGIADVAGRIIHVEA